ncbi:MAG: NDP-hexose-3-ketoreductase [Arcticibacterium sp.]|jgi:NDP-hexose-3-ketoreductase
MNQVTIGVLGLSDIAQRAIIPNIIENQNFKLSAIASRSKDKIDAFVNKSGDGSLKYYSSYHKLIQQGDCQAIYVPLPNAMHFEYILASLEKGIHVLCEKSLTCSYRQTQQLMDLARTKGLVIVENFQFRFHKQLTVITDLIKRKEFGELRVFNSTFCFPPFPEKNNIRYSKELGGGALLDAGAYPIKLAQIILGTDLNVEAAKYHVDAQTGVDIWGGAFLSHSVNSTFGHASFGFDNFYRCSVELIGQNGRITTNRIFTAKPDNEVSILFEHGYESEVIKLSPDNAYINMLDHFHGLISLNQPDQRELEYIQNLHQSRLLHQFKQKLNG